MINEQILRAAIEKANTNGYGRDDIKIKSDLTDKSFGIIFAFSIIFSHDFAKAFWGEEEIETDEQSYSGARYSTDTGEFIGPVIEFKKKPIWQYHLQQMVLEEDPIKYLEKYL